MQIYLIIGGIIAILIIVILSLIIALQSKTKRIKELKNDNKVLNENVLSLVKYSDLISKMRNEKEELNNEILQAETTEEIMDIINRIISNNNNRVRK
jgi:biopolymer transport protein ExbB/TolQ